MWQTKKHKIILFFPLICVAFYLFTLLRTPMNSIPRIANGLNRLIPDEVRFTPPSLPSTEKITKIAFYNLLTTHVTDNPVRTIRNEQYRWEKRYQPLIALIQEERPAVLGICELDLRQVKTLKAELEIGGKLEDYQLCGFSSELGLRIEETEKQFQLDQQAAYGECIGFLVDTRQTKLLNIECIQLPKKEMDGKAELQKYNRILVKGDFQHTATKTHFICLASHFDHQSKSGRQESAALELQLIQSLQEKKIPWFSLSDRNWDYGEEGEASYTLYRQSPGVCDFRDNTEFGEYGPTGSFPSYNVTRKMVTVTTPDSSSAQMLDAPMIDPCFYSDCEKVKSLYCHTRTGEFNPKTLQLLPASEQGDLSKRYFPSDHYYMSGAFVFREDQESAR